MVVTEKLGYLDSTFKEQKNTERKKVHRKVRYNTVPKVCSQVCRKYSNSQDLKLGIMTTSGTLVFPFPSSSALLSIGDEIEQKQYPPPFNAARCYNCDPCHVGDINSLEIIRFLLLAFTALVLSSLEFSPLVTHCLTSPSRPSRHPR